MILILRSILSDSVNTSGSGDKFEFTACINLQINSHWQHLYPGCGLHHLSASCSHCFWDGQLLQGCQPLHWTEIVLATTTSQQCFRESFWCSHVQSYGSSHCNILTTHCPRCLWPADFCRVTRWLTYYQTVNNKNILLS